MYYILTSTSDQQLLHFKSLSPYRFLCLHSRISYLQLSYIYFLKMYVSIHFNIFHSYMLKHFYNGCYCCHWVETLSTVLNPDLDTSGTISICTDSAPPQFQMVLGVVCLIPERIKVYSFPIRWYHKFWSPTIFPGLFPCPKSSNGLSKHSLQVLLIHSVGDKVRYTIYMFASKFCISIHLIPLQIQTDSLYLFTVVVFLHVLLSLIYLVLK